MVHRPVEFERDTRARIDVQRAHRRGSGAISACHPARVEVEDRVVVEGLADGSAGAWNTSSCNLVPDV